MGRSPGCDTLYLELSVAGLHTAMCKISEENYFRLSDLGLDHSLFFFPLSQLFHNDCFLSKKTISPFPVNCKIQKYILNFPWIFFQYFDNSQLNQMSNLRTNEYIHVHTSGSHYNIKLFVSLKMWVDVCLCESDM